jgi:hypothetical protein
MSLLFLDAERTTVLYLIWKKYWKVNEDISNSKVPKYRTFQTKQSELIENYTKKSRFLIKITTICVESCARWKNADISDDE